MEKQQMEKQQMEKQQMTRDQRQQKIEEEYLAGLEQLTEQQLRDELIWIDRETARFAAAIDQYELRGMAYQKRLMQRGFERCGVRYDAIEAELTRRGLPLVG